MHVDIDGVAVEADAGETVLQAAVRAGVEIPTLCHHPGLSAVGSCRLCLVELQGSDRLAPACMQPVAEGLSVRTQSPLLTEQRRMVLRMLLRQLPADALTGAGSERELARWCREYAVAHSEDAPEAMRFPRDSDPNPFIRVDLNQCILCTRCVRACAEIQGRFVWGIAERGASAHIAAGVGTTMLEADCESCGACAAVCPTGALVDRLAAEAGPADRLVRTTCTYCGVGCQFDLQVREERVIGVAPAVDAPVNGMSLCVKGRYGFDFVHHPERLTQPLVRSELLEEGSQRRAPGADRGPWRAVSWDRALDLVADRLVQVRRESGRDAVGLLSSAKCSNEENYLLQKLGRQVLGTNNIDHCARLCHSSTVAGLSMALGSGAMTNSLRDVAERSAAVFIIGSNTTEQHPVFGAQLRQAVLRRGLPIVVADPRRIDVTKIAAIHLRQRPGTDLLLLNGLMQLMSAAGYANARFIAERTEGYDAFRESLTAYDPDLVARETGVPRRQLEQAAELLGTHAPLAVVWAMGITQHTTGVSNVLALANLQLMLGNLGVPGGGLNPLRGQNNVQGACDMGALPNVYPGYQAVTDDAVRERFETAWRLEGSAAGGWGLPSTPGLTVTEMLEAAGRREIRGLYVLAENPVLTDPDSNHVRESLARAEFVVLQEIFPSATADYADVLLPGTAFAERSGTFTNTERRVQLFRRAVAPPGAARPEWEVLSDLAHRLMARQSLRPSGPAAAWQYASSGDILAEAAGLTPIYAGVSAARLAAGEPLQWPVPDARHPGTPILHAATFPRGRGRFHVVHHAPPQEGPDAEYPLILTTGRVLYHWHGGEMTRRAAGLVAVCPEPVVELSPDDARSRGIAAGDVVELRSRRGTMTARADVTDRMAAGVVFGNFHFPGAGNVNNPTIAALDPVAKIPEYKACAVAVSRRG